MFQFCTIKGQGLYCLLLLSVAAGARADSLETQQKALDLITATADKLCNVISTHGDVGSSTVKGDVKAQLSGLAAKLLDVGVSGAGSINNEHYQNVLRQDLAATLQSSAACKLKVFETLEAKLTNADAPLPTAAVPAPPAGQPASATAPADISGKWRDISAGTVFDIAQNKAAIKITGVNPAFDTAGSGNVSGRTFQNAYVTKYHSGEVTSGKCQGLLSEDALSITLHCDDVRAGPWATTAVR